MQSSWEMSDCEINLLVQKELVQRIVGILHKFYCNVRICFLKLTAEFFFKSGNVGAEGCWVICTCSAALVKLRSRASAMKYSIDEKFIVSHLFSITKFICITYQ